MSDSAARFVPPIDAFRLKGSEEMPSRSIHGLVQRRMVKGAISALLESPASRRTSARSGVFTGCIALLLLVVALAPAVRAQSSTPDRLRLHGVDYLGDLPTLVAEQRGLFARHGLDVTVTTGLSGSRNLQALRAGETDFALMALTPLVLDRLADGAAGQPDDPVILANLVQATHLDHVVTLAGNGIEGVADLQGRRVGLMRGTNAEFMWWLFATYHRLQPAAVTLVDLPVHRIADALSDGSVDAAVLWEPWASRLAERHGEQLLELPGSRIYSARWVLVSSRRMAREQPRLCRDLLAAYRDAIDYIARHPDEALQMVAERTGGPLDNLHREEMSRYGLNLDWSLIAGLQQQVEWAAASGYPVARAEPALLSWIESGPLRLLDPILVGIPPPVPAGQP